MNFFLVKSEPGSYSFSQLVKDGTTMWEGVRNYSARNFLRTMKKGDRVLFYHSGDEKAVVGIAHVNREAYPDPTTKEDWSVVDLAADRKFSKPVPLIAIKKEKKLKDIPLVKQGRLSVMPLKKTEFDIIVEMGD